MLKYKDETIGIGHVDLSEIDYAYDNGFVSRNLFDEQMEIGGIDITSGANVTYTTRMRSVNYTEIDATKSYYICTQSTVSTSATKLRVFYYDSSKTFISYQDWTNELTIPSGAKYLRFITIDGYGTTYNNDIILNVSDNKNGTYQPYSKSNIELTKIVSNNYSSMHYAHYDYTFSGTSSSGISGSYYKNNIALSDIITDFNAIKTKIVMINAIRPDGSTSNGVLTFGYDIDNNKCALHVMANNIKIHFTVLYTD